MTIISQPMVGVIGHVGRLVINIVGRENREENEFVNRFNMKKSKEH